MAEYILRRLLLIFPTLLGISFVTFLVVQLAPGDPIAAKLGPQVGEAQEALTPQVIEELRKLYGLDKPLLERYWIWLQQLVTLDFGYSFVDDRPVLDKLLERFPISLQLSTLSIFLAYLIAIPLGVTSAVHRQSLYDQVTTIFVFVLYSLPNFWIALLLILFLGGGEFLTLLPIYGLNSPGIYAPWEISEGMSWDWSLFFPWLSDRLWHLILPVFCLTYVSLARLSRFARVSTLDVIQQDYIRTARAKGLPEKLVIFRHAFRNSLIPIITLLAFELPSILGGSVIIESIFSIPGMGQLAFESILHRDYPTIMGIFTLSAFLTLIGFLLADILYVMADPRIRYH